MKRIRASSLHCLTRSKSNTMKLLQVLSGLKALLLIGLFMIAILAGCDKDSDPDVRPTVLSTGPESNATGVALNSTISVVFSTAMNATTGSKLSLKQGAADVAGTSVHVGTTSTFTPASNLLENTLYTATVSKTAMNKNGTAMVSDYSWSFTTGAAPDLTIPIVSTTTPSNNSVGVPRNQVLSILFSETMEASTISATSFTLTQGTNVIAGTVTYTDNTATFSPSTLLAAGTVYTATITTAAKDLAGNPLASNATWNFTTANSAATLAFVDLGQAGAYVVLAKTAINNSSTSAITGDMGLSPAATSYITGLALTDFTGYATSSQITGKVYAADMASPTPVNLTTAVENMITAYNDAAGRPSPDFLELATGDIGGKTLTPGLYKWTSTVTIPTDVVISGGANDIWIFQISGDLTVSSAVNMVLTGGAQAKNIFWQVAGEATLGTTSHFEGNILSMTGITFQTGASFKGRALAQTAVIFDSNAVTMPD